MTLFIIKNVQLAKMLLYNYYVSTSNFNSVLENQQISKDFKH